MFTDILLILFYILILTTAYLAYKNYKYYRSAVLLEQVSWCVTEDSRCRCNLKLIDYIHNEQRRNHLEEQYR